MYFILNSFIKCFYLFLFHVFETSVYFHHLPLLTLFSPVGYSVLRLENCPLHFVLKQPQSTIFPQPFEARIHLNKNQALKNSSSFKENRLQTLRNVFLRSLQDNAGIVRYVEKGHERLHTNLSISFDGYNICITDVVTCPNNLPMKLFLTNITYVMGPI